MSQSDRVITAKLANMLYYYVNNTKRNQLIRVTNERKITLEKIVFPQQRILFEAMPEVSYKFTIVKEKIQNLPKLFLVKI